MQRVPHQVVNQHRNPADPQAFIDKSWEFFCGQMMCEQGAAHQVKTCILKGKREGITGQCTVAVSQMRGRSIQQGDLQVQPVALQALASRLGTYPDPAATSSRESDEAWSFVATRLTISSVVETPPNQRLIRCKSSSEEATSAAVPESVSSNSAMTTRFIERAFPQRIPGITEGTQKLAFLAIRYAVGV